MGFFKGFFSKRKEKKLKEKWTHQKEGIQRVINELELPLWLDEWMMLIINQEEKKSGPLEMSHWIEEEWLKKEDIPEDFKDETMLLHIYENYTDWVEEYVAMHVDVRQPEYEGFEDLIAERGKPITSMKLEAQRSYLAIWGEVLNVISQGMDV